MKCGGIDTRIRGRHDLICRTCGFDPDTMEESANDNFPEVLIVTPTFLKDLENYVVQATWKKCFAHIKSADRLIFIGYSLPEADFHFREMLLRAWSKKWEIEVITIKTNSKANDELLKERYLSFFGKKVNFRWQGLEGTCRKQKSIEKIL